jgi:hypothetical protein
VVVPASVAGSVVDPVRLHPPPAASVVQQADQGVGARSAVSGDWSSGDGLGGNEVILADQPGVSHCLGNHPVLWLIPPLSCPLSSSADGRITIGALPVPDLPTGVTRVGQDHGNSAQRPVGARAVSVTAWIRTRRASDSPGVQCVGDAGRAVSGEAFSKDPLDMAGGGRVRFQPLQPSTPTGMRSVGVRSGVGQSVAVGWPAALIAAPAQRSGPDGARSTATSSSVCSSTTGTSPRLWSASKSGVPGPEQSRSPTR